MKRQSLKNFPSKQEESSTRITVSQDYAKQLGSNHNPESDASQAEHLPTPGLPSASQPFGRHHIHLWLGFLLLEIPSLTYKASHEKKFIETCILP